jgi:signal peptidase
VPDPVPGRDPDESFVHRLWGAETGPLFFLRELVTSAGAVLLVGLLLFGVSGVWPPMVAVESGSMEPHMHKGDLVFITEPGRYTPDAAYGSTGVVTAEAGTDIDYRTFGGPGSVVVYDDPGRGGPPIIHRARFYVEAGENWYDRANPEFVSADSCRELLNCPAPHAGFITKGDANARYDQASGIAEPVKPSWITGIARVRIPYLGWVRLGLADVVQGTPGPAVGTPNAAAKVDVEMRHALGERQGTVPVDLSKPTDPAERDVTGRIGFTDGTRDGPGDETHSDPSRESSWPTAPSGRIRATTTVGAA